MVITVLIAVQHSQPRPLAHTFFHIYAAPTKIMTHLNGVVISMSSHESMRTGPNPGLPSYSTFFWGSSINECQRKLGEGKPLFLVDGLFSTSSRANTT